jgi:hypothetical protein
VPKRGTLPDDSDFGIDFGGAMSSKRPDQYRDEAGATDLTERANDEHIRAEDKQHVKENPHDQPMIPVDGVNPALRELRDRKKAKPAPESEESAE